MEPLLNLNGSFDEKEIDKPDGEEIVDDGKPKKEEWVEPDVLSRQQINQCWMDIDDIHPLRDRV